MNQPLISLETLAAISELIDAAEGFRSVTSGDDAGRSGMIACARLDDALASPHLDVLRGES